MFFIYFNMDSYLEISITNIIKNYHILKDRYKMPIICVIKDNAYGHGLLKVGQELSKYNPLMFAVSSLQEAIMLRKNLIFTPILLLGRCDDLKTLLSFKITPGISSLSQLKILSSFNISIPIHLEIETGMNRLGLTIDELQDALDIINNSRLKLKGIYTHLCSDNYQNQIDIFKKALDLIQDKKGLIIHIQASKYLDLNLSFVNAVRIGLSLYGYSNTLKLMPAMKYYLPVWKCKNVYKGERVGYDELGLVEENAYLLTIPIGYSTSFSKISLLKFLYEDNVLTQIGKSCMDMTMFISKNKIKEGTYINILSYKNIEFLINNFDVSIYYLLSSISSSIQRKYT